MRSSLEELPNMLTIPPHNWACTNNLEGSLMWISQIYYSPTLVLTNLYDFGVKILKSLFPNIIEYYRLIISCGFMVRKYRPAMLGI